MRMQWCVCFLDDCSFLLIFFSFVAFGLVDGILSGGADYVSFDLVQHLV